MSKIKTFTTEKQFKQYLQRCKKNSREIDNNIDVLQKIGKKALLQIALESKAYKHLGLHAAKRICVNETRKVLKIADEWKRVSKCYFWNTPGNASGRRYMESQTYQDFELLLNSTPISGEINISVSCRNVYNRSTLHSHSSLGEVNSLLIKTQKEISNILFKANIARFFIVRTTTEEKTYDGLNKKYVERPPVEHGYHLEKSGHYFTNGNYSSKFSSYNSDNTANNCAIQCF